MFQILFRGLTWDNLKTVITVSRLPFSSTFWCTCKKLLKFYAKMYTPAAM